MPVTRTNFYSALESGLYVAQQRAALEQLLSPADYQQLVSIAGPEGVLRGQTELEAVYKLLSKKNLTEAQWNSFMGLASTRPLGPTQLVEAANALVTAINPTTGQPYAHEYHPDEALTHGYLKAGAGVNKCNIFVGNVLLNAGFEAPIAPNGHFASAETWASAAYDDIFEPVAVDPENPAEVFELLQPGDVLVWDYLGVKGAGGGHVELVTSVGPLKADGTADIVTAGAHGYPGPSGQYGAFNRNVNTQGSPWFNAQFASYDPATNAFEWAGGDYVVYVLRPVNP